MNQNLKSFLLPLALGILSLSFMGSCSKKADSSNLAPIVDSLNLDLKKIAETSPMFLSNASATLDAEKNQVEITIDFCDSIVNVQNLSGALVEFFTAQQMKNTTGNKVPDFLNNLSAEKGSVNLILKDVYGHTQDFTIDAERLKKIYKLPPMQLNFNEVKENVLKLFAGQCEGYKESAKAIDCTFELKNNFAEYTFVFEKESNYSNLTQGSLKGRYLRTLSPCYDRMQTLRTPVETFLQSMQIEGYRFVYTTKDGKGKELRVAIPWRDI